MVTKDQIKQDLQAMEEYKEDNPLEETLEDEGMDIHESNIKTREEAAATADDIDVVPEQPPAPQDGYIDNMPITEEALGDLDDNYLKSDPQVVGYRDEQEQEIVYDFVASNFDATQESILDIGCGRGDFLRHIREIYQTDIKYHGVDMNKVLIGVAKELDPDGEFTASNLFKLDGNYAADWVINIGGLSVIYEPVGEDFDQMDALKNTVIKMMELADVGIVVSLLSLNTPDAYDDTYLAYDPIEVLDWSLNEFGQLGGNVRLDHSIADSMFTLTIFK
jgi:SAM-dependent methyltransferase